MHVAAKGLLRLAPRGRAASTVAFAAVLLLGLALRLLALRTSLAQQDSDRAIVYLMARHVAHGEFRVFYWGQFYGGTLIQLVAGGVFRVVGASFAALQVVEIAFWLAASLLLRSTVSRAAGLLAGDVAGALFWLGAPIMVAISFSDPGFYGDGTAMGLAAVLLAQRGGRPRIARCLAIGLCLGLSLWTSPLALALTVPAAVWLGLRIRTLRAAVAGLAGAVFGAAPWLYETWKSHFGTFHRLPGQPTSPPTRYLHVFTEIVPAAAGLSPLSVGGRAVGFAVLAGFVVGAGAAIRSRNVTVAVLGLAGLLVPAVIVASAVQVVPTSTRYATLLAPSLAAVLAWTTRRVGRAAAVLVVLASAWTLATVWNSTNGLTRVADPAVGRPVVALAARLEQMGRTAVWADYSVAYVLSAASQERIIAGDLSPRREESYLLSAAQAPRTTVVLSPGMSNEQTLRGLENLPPHHRTLVGPFAVWTFDTRVDVGRYLLAPS